MQSTFSGPNQLGLWLLLPWSITLLAFCTSGSLLDRFIQKFRFSVGCKRYLHDALLVIIGLALFFTFSRSAWIAAAVVILLMLHRTLTMQEFRKSLVRIGGVCIAVFLLSALLAPQVILRATSSNDHLLRPIQAAHIMRGNPLGLGLGSAGPASNRVSDTCIFLEDGSDVLWTLNHPSLCVFVGGTQVQPKAHCSCPLLTENWYLQIGVELGILGFILYIFLTILLLKKLATSETGPRYAVFLIFAGVSTASLFLHAWEGSAVAYTVWLLVAVNLKVSLRRFFFGRFSS
jgi:hypothetical protein